jgi:citrate lyase alpha subunit
MNGNMLTLSRSSMTEGAEGASSQATITTRISIAIAPRLRIAYTRITILLENILLHPLLAYIVL